MTATTSSPAGADDRLARRNVLVLALAQALAGGNSTVMLATGAITGSMLAPSRGLATLPITAFVMGQWIGTLPVGALARRYGRRTAFQASASCGVVAGFLAFVAVMLNSFALFIVATFVGGLYAAGQAAYRFAAADTASEAFRPKAISLVMAGGVLAALFGPQLVIFTKDMLPPYLFAASYLAQAVIGVFAVLLLGLVNIPKPAPVSATADRGRPLSEFIRMPRFIVAVACGVISFSVMNLVMTSAPLAMLDCNHSVTDATLGIQWHVLGMFAPSFFTGALCARFGAGRVVAAGLTLTAASAVVAIAGITLAHFWISLILLGVGWNFGYIGATTMVTACHRPEERIRVQAFNDFLVFGSLAISSLSSGLLMATVGWSGINEAVFPVVMVAVGMLAWLTLRERRRMV